MAFDLTQYRWALSDPQYMTPTSAWVGHFPFAWALLEMARPASVVELGTHRGDSYCAFCQGVVQLKLPTRCTAIDTWQGDPQAGAYGPQVLDELRAYHDPRYGVFSTLRQADFDTAVRDFADGSIDLLHIDGLHTYDAVKHDFQTWRSKLSPRAVVLFHDVAVRDKGYGVAQFWDELSPDFPSFAFEHSYGLGVLGVGSDLPEPVAEFFRAANSQGDLVRQYFSVLGHRMELLKLIQFWSRALDQQRQMLDPPRQRAGDPPAPIPSQSPFKAIGPLMSDLARLVGSRR